MRDCDAVVAVIGKTWALCTDADGQPRLNDSEDFVRMEIVTALEYKIRLIPVLVGGAQMPRTSQLPESLHGLTRRNALAINDLDFQRGSNLLIESIERAIQLTKEKRAQEQRRTQDEQRSQNETAQSDRNRTTAASMGDREESNSSRGDFGSKIVFGTSTVSETALSSARPWYLSWKTGVGGAAAIIAVVSVVTLQSPKTVQPEPVVTTATRAEPSPNKDVPQSLTAPPAETDAPNQSRETTLQRNKPIVDAPHEHVVKVPPPRAQGVAAIKPVSPIRVGGAAMEASLLRKIQPIYPPLAKSARVQGTVEFSAIVSEEGNIESLQLVRGHPLLVNAAKEAVLQWRYRPTLFEGRPVKVVTDIIVNFTLSL